MPTRKTIRKSRAANASANARDSHDDWTIGIDLGGTKVLTALVDSRGRALHQTTRPVIPPESPHLDQRDPSRPSPTEVRKHISFVIDSIADSIEECADQLDKKDQKKIRGIGLASAGPMDLQKGYLVDASNFKGWGRVALIDKLAKNCAKRNLTAPLKARAHFQNDAVAAALGEGWIGVAKSKSTYVMITVGTGIGTGVILNGSPAQSAGRGAEWGHLMCDTRGLSDRLGDADRGTPDGIASGTGLVRQAHRRGLHQFTSAQEIALAAQQGDKQAKKLLIECSEALAGLLYSLSLGFNPEVFAISGGMLAMSDSFLPQAIDLYRRAIRVKYPTFEKPVRVSKTGTMAGVIGAARLPRL